MYVRLRCVPGVLDGRVIGERHKCVDDERRTPVL